MQVNVDKEETKIFIEAVLSNIDFLIIESKSCHDMQFVSLQTCEWWKAKPNVRGNRKRNILVPIRDLQVAEMPFANKDIEAKSALIGQS